MEETHPLAFYIRYLPDPTPGAPPTCSIWFHLGLLHIILDERLVGFESYENNYIYILTLYIMN